MVPHHTMVVPMEMVTMEVVTILREVKEAKVVDTMVVDTMVVDTMMVDTILREAKITEEEVMDTEVEVMVVTEEEAMEVATEEEEAMEVVIVEEEDMETMVTTLVAIIIVLMVVIIIVVDITQKEVKVGLVTIPREVSFNRNIPSVVLDMTTEFRMESTIMVIALLVLLLIFIQKVIKELREIVVTSRNTLLETKALYLYQMKTHSIKKATWLYCLNGYPRMNTYSTTL